MRKIILSILLILSAFLCANALFAAWVEIPWGSIIEKPSIGVEIKWWDIISSGRDFAFRILWLLKVVVSGFALIYIVLIGVYMVVFSENEERVKMQRKQFIYTLIGFLFLNIPWVVYTAFNPENKGGGFIGNTNNWSDVTGGSVFWDAYWFEGFFGNLIAFLRVFVFGIAILTLTWGIFKLIVSAGDDEKQKEAKHRITYGAIGLILMGFVEWWGKLVSGGDFTKYIPYIGNKLFGVALFFAAPLAIFFLIWWAYQYITSAGDEEKVKKGKAIIVNTFIATLILLAAMSFLTDLVNFKL
jgi:Type IV secretion system pilin